MDMLFYELPFQYLTGIGSIWGEVVGSCSFWSLQLCGIFIMYFLFLPIFF